MKKGETVEKYEVIRTWKDGELVEEKIEKRTISGDLKKAEQLQELPKEIKERIEKFTTEEFEDTWKKFKINMKKIDKFFDDLFAGIR
jgi:macrodomain Ter protein organizer (MatP/YcbG family)